MSVFRGSITEYPGVIVDHFSSFNCNRGRVFFLSHCHKDHMTGLNSPQIVDSLKRRSSSLYCSEVTRSLLLQDPEFTQLAPFLKGLPMDEPVPMSLEAYTDSHALNFTVTLLPAGHCPGSSMFFYQGPNGGVLYTGDFRLTLDETKRLKSLHCGGSDNSDLHRLLEIKSLYLDTTFYHPIATHIPSRDVSRGYVLKIVESWLSKDQRNVIHLQLGMFGYEHIYMALAKKFNTRVHIARWRLNAYKDIPAVADCLTNDGETTRIHACKFKKGVRCFGVPCGSRYQHGQPPPVLGIKPSTLWFLSNSSSLKEPYKYIPESNVYRVLHSMHASYSEVCDFISYLKPKRIVPCVIPLGDRSLSDVKVRLKTLLPHVEVVSSELESTTAGSSNTNTYCCNIKKLKSEKKKSDKAVDLDDCSENTIDDFASSEETPNSDCDKSTITSKFFALPSMFSDCPSESVILDGYKPNCVQESIGSSSNATVGSLEQTPIDLSPDYTPGSSLDTSSVSTNHFHSIKVESDDSSIRSNKEKDEEITNKEQIESEYRHDSGQRSREDDSALSQVEALINSSEGRRESSDDEDDWHLTLENSTEDDQLSAPNSPSLSNEQKSIIHSLDSYKETATPQAKRFKPSYDHRSDSSSTDIEGDIQPYTLTTTSTKPTTSDLRSEDDNEHRSLSVEIIEPINVIEYIDLTQDYQPLQDDTGTVKPPPINNTTLSQTYNGRNMSDSKSIEECNSSYSERNLDCSSSQRSLSEQKITTVPNDEVSPQSPATSVHSHSLKEQDTVDYKECSPTSSRVSRSNSPLCLPPTPGRERVEAILDRKNIAF